MSHYKRQALPLDPTTSRLNDALRLRVTLHPYYLAPLTVNTWIDLRLPEDVLMNDKEFLTEVSSTNPDQTYRFGTRWIQVAGEGHLKEVWEGRLLWYADGPPHLSPPRELRDMEIRRRLVKLCPDATVLVRSYDRPTKGLVEEWAKLIYDTVNGMVQKHGYSYQAPRLGLPMKNLPENQVVSTKISGEDKWRQEYMNNPVNSKDRTSLD